MQLFHSSYIPLTFYYSKVHREFQSKTNSCWRKTWALCWSTFPHSHVQISLLFFLFVCELGISWILTTTETRSFSFWSPLAVFWADFCPWRKQNTYNATPVYRSIWTSGRWKDFSDSTPCKLKHHLQKTSGTGFSCLLLILYLYKYPKLWFGFNLVYFTPFSPVGVLWSNFS